MVISNTSHDNRSTDKLSDTTFRLQIFAKEMIQMQVLSIYPSIKIF